MKICCLSDLHGMRIEIPECDLLLIAGDIFETSISTHGHYYHECMKYVNSMFVWLNGLDHVKDVIITPGNHDGFFQEFGITHMRRGKVQLIVDSFADYPIKIYGFPWTLTYGDWAYMLPQDFMAAKVKEIPDDTQILLSHGPAYGTLDITKDLNVGCSSLRDRIKKLDSLKLHVFGHIHEARGLDLLNGYKAVNASVCSIWHDVCNEPIAFEMDF